MDHATRGGAARGDRASAAALIAGRQMERSLMWHACSTPRAAAGGRVCWSQRHDRSAETRSDAANKINTYIYIINVVNNTNFKAKIVSVDVIY